MNRFETIWRITNEFRLGLEKLDNNELEAVASGKYMFSLIKKVRDESGGASGKGFGKGQGGFRGRGGLGK